MVCRSSKQDNTLLRENLGHEKEQERHLGSKVGRKYNQKSVGREHSAQQQIEYDSTDYSVGQNR